MKTFLHSKFQNNLAYNIKLHKNASILIGLSGGQDSLCMAKLFLDIKAVYSLNIGIISIDHQWRYDTVNNINHLVNINQSLNIKTYIYAVNPSSYTEEEARDIRYQLFIKTAKTHNYSFIATAHSLSDQIETGLHHIFRGSYIDNLTSLTWQRNFENKICIIRPMLNMQRWEINWFCRYFSLPIWHDLSNLTCNYERNRIRQELMPYIAYHFSYSIYKQIHKFIHYASVDSEYIRQNILKLYLDIRHPYCIAINISKLMYQHQALQERLIYLYFLHNLNINIPNHLLVYLLNQIEHKFIFSISYNRINICSNKKWLYFYINT